MDRDRERDRDRGDRRFVRPKVSHVAEGAKTPSPTRRIELELELTCNRDDRFSNTYRPRSPRPRSPRGDSYRAGRSPPRRGLASADTYTPGSRSVRPRSRSPAFRRRSRSPRRDDNWRARPRSPPRRTYSPRRDEPRRDDSYRGDRGRSPRRDGYDSYARSPRPRERSPPPRDREASPARSRGVRSPVRTSRYEEPRSRINRYTPVYPVMILPANCYKPPSSLLTSTRHARLSPPLPISQTRSHRPSYRRHMAAQISVPSQTRIHIERSLWEGVRSDLTPFIAACYSP